MASILSFVPRSAAESRTERTAGAASIIIFPGVRYEPAGYGTPVSGIAPRPPRKDARKPPHH